MIELCRLIKQNEIGSCQDSILKMQHVHLCGIRNFHWNRKNKDFNHLYNQAAAWEKVIAFHLLIMKEMSERTFRYDFRWTDPSFRGIRYETLDPSKYSYSEIKRLFTNGLKGQRIFQKKITNDEFQTFIANSIIPKAVKVHG